MQTDLRAVDPDAYWARFAEMMGGDGLLTYRYLGRKTAMLHGVPYDTMKIRRDMRTATGGLMAAPLAIAAAEAGGFSDVDSVPAPMTAELTIIDDGVGVREILIRRSILHAGRTIGFTRSEIVDADDPGRLIAIAHGSGIRLAGAPPGFQPLELPEEIADGPDLPTLSAVFGVRSRPDGRWELPSLSPAAMSTSGSLHLGPTHIVLETAATALAARAGGTDALQIEAWSVMFTARGTHGPFVAEGAAIVGRPGRVGCTVELRDAGRGDRIVAAASGTFRSPV